jgi:hypothetical protein
VHFLQLSIQEANGGAHSVQLAHRSTASIYSALLHTSDNFPLVVLLSALSVHVAWRASVSSAIMNNVIACFHASSACEMLIADKVV